jgi:Domain of unknown function DUF29
MTQPTAQAGVATIYDDILIWSKEQAALLRRVAAGERFNDEGPDWDNIIEEIESVGREQLHAVESLLGQALRYMLKAEAWPLHRDAPTWRADAIDLRGQAANRFAPSMRQRIDVPKLYRRVLRALPDTMDGQPPLPVRQACPVTLDELLSGDWG